MATQYTAGLVAGEILTAATMNSIGASWVAYTPTLSGWTQGNGTFTTAYQQINKLIVYRGVFVGGSTTTAASFFDISFPVPANAFYDTYKQPLVDGNYYDTSTGANYNLQALWISTTIRFACINTAGTFAQVENLSGTSPVSYGAGDFISWTILYEAA
jgi:hypothetical protein